MKLFKPCINGIFTVVNLYRMKLTDVVASG